MSEMNPLHQRLVSLLSRRKTDTIDLKNYLNQIKEATGRELDHLDEDLSGSLRDIYEEEKYSQVSELPKLLDQLELGLTEAEIYPRSFSLSYMEIYRSRAFLELHRGGWNVELGDRYESFLDEYREVLFPNRLVAFGSELDDFLSLIHIRFNSLDFANAIPAIEGEISRYLRILGEFDGSKEPVRDKTLARLYGSLGQALVFLGDLEGRWDFTERGRKFLEMDLSLLDRERDERHVKQGLNFLVTLSWSEGRADEAWKLLESIGQKSGGRGLTAEGSFLFPEALVNDGQAFSLLNQLRLMALDQHLGRSSFEVESLIPLVESILNKQGLNYPMFMILKWTLWILSSNQPLAASVLLKTEQSLLAMKAEHPTSLIRLMHLPLFWLVGGEILRDEIDFLEDQAKALPGWACLIHNRHHLLASLKEGRVVDGWEMMRFFPYYFS